MPNGTDVGRAPHTATDAALANKPAAGRCACGRPLAGYDADREEAVCRWCADTDPVRADGGVIVDGTYSPEMEDVEYVHDPVTPEKFIVRCTECGQIDTTTDRADAHDKADTHGVLCAPAGVTPVSRRRTEKPTPVPDGGRVVAPDCSHTRVRRYGRTDATGAAVIERRCADCGRTLDVGGRP